MTEPNADLPPVDPSPTPNAAPRPSRTVCEFCGCALDAHGNVIKRGERAAKVIDLERDLSERDRTIDALRKENAALRPAEPERKRSSMFGFSQE